jgi:3,4-dihydroxy-2-butanone 4-phosphate synthase
MDRGRAGPGHVDPVQADPRAVIERKARATVLVTAASLQHAAVRAEKVTLNVTAASQLDAAVRGTSIGHRVDSAGRLQVSADRSAAEAMR